MQELRKKLKDHPYAEKSGSVLYSQKSTLKPGIYYFLGLNPGGEPTDDESERLKNNLLPKHDANAYYQVWSSPDAGFDPLQKSARKFLASLEFTEPKYAESIKPENLTDPEKFITEQEMFIREAQHRFIKSVCSSNLYFLRSRNIKALKKGQEKEPEKDISQYIYWPIHKYIINEIVNPSIIIVYGMDAGYAVLKEQLLGMTKEACIPTGRAEKSKRRYPAVEFALFDDDKLLVGIPHLSRYAYCTQQENEVWRSKGLPELLKHCNAVKEKRKAQGPTWRFC